MEYWVYLHSSWKLKLVVDASFGLSNSKRSQLCVVQFIARSLRFDITSQEVYFIPLLESRSPISLFVVVYR